MRKRTRQRRKPQRAQPTPALRLTSTRPTPSKTKGAKRSQDVPRDAGRDDSHNHARRMYEATRNPVYVWEALGSVLASYPQYDPNAGCYNLPPASEAQIPDWIGHYLARVATRFAHMSRHEPQETYEGVERRVAPTKPRSANLGPERRYDARKLMYRPDDPVFFVRPKKNEIATAVYQALEFVRRGNNTGPANPFRMIADQSHDACLAASVYFKLREYPKLDLALDLVADEHPKECSANPPCTTISRSTVARAWRKHGADLGARSSATS